MKIIKSSDNIYEKNITITNLYSMWNIIRKTCKNRKQVYYFSLNLETNIYQIYYELRTKTYLPGKYKVFLIHEPKARLVMSQSIKDKIVNHFVTNYFLIPYLESKLINQNVATRMNMGTKYAHKLLNNYLNKLIINNYNQELYCLKLDISKYFYTIDHHILIKMLKKYLKDQDVIALIQLILKQTNSHYINEYIIKNNKKYHIEIPLYKKDRGLSIGALTSQFLAIFYLNDLDHFIKEDLKCKYYIRYMDDFIILDNNKDKLIKAWNKIKEKILELNIQLNAKSNLYKVSNGFNFLGYCYKVNNNKLIRRGSKKTVLRINRRLRYLYNNDKIMYLRSLASLQGYFKTYQNIEKRTFKMKIEEIYKLYKHQYPQRIVIIKQGIFYKTFYEDAKILWLLFKYKIKDNVVSFGNTPYDKVITTLKDLDLGIIVVDKTQELLNMHGDIEVYNSYNVLAKHKANKVNKKKILIDKLDELLALDFDNYYHIALKFFDELIVTIHS